MQSIGFSRRLFGRSRISQISTALVAGTMLFSFNGSAQETQSKQQSSPPMSAEHTGPPIGLQDLLQGAEQDNPQIQAARQGWQAAKQVPTQVSTLPDPQFNLQQVNVGSPRPFAGYTNSDFAYIGLGVSQDLPYPGKLRLKGEIAKRDAASPTGGEGSGRALPLGNGESARLAPSPA